MIRSTPQRCGAQCQDHATDKARNCVLGPNHDGAHKCLHEDHYKLSALNDPKTADVLNAGAARLRSATARHKELRAQGVPYPEVKEIVLREQRAAVAKVEHTTPSGSRVVVTADNPAVLPEPRALNGEGKAGRLIVSLSEDDRVALINLAALRGVSQAEVVRGLIREEAKRASK